MPPPVDFTPILNAVADIAAQVKLVKDSITPAVDITPVLDAVASLSTQVQSLQDSVTPMVTVLHQLVTAPALPADVVQKLTDFLNAQAAKPTVDWASLRTQLADATKVADLKDVLVAVVEALAGVTS